MSVFRHNNTLFFCSLLLMLLLSSCVNENQSTDDAEEIVVNIDTLPIDSKADTNLRLEFSSMVRAIFEDSRGHYWFGSDKEGVCVFDGKSFTYFNTEDGLGDNQVRTIQEDEHGNMWFATGGGVSSFDGEKFTIYADQYNRLQTEFIIPIWEMETTDLWFNRGVSNSSILEGGIYRYDGQKFSTLAFPDLVLEYDGFSQNKSITGICRGQNNMLWIASYGGVFGFDGTSFYLINEPHLQYHVRAIMEDSKGNLWIGNNGIGVLHYDGETTTKLSDQQSLDLFFGMSYPHHVFALAEDSSGNIWIGDRDTGAWRYDGKTLKNYTTEDGLTDNFVRVIYENKKGQLWFGLNDGSVCQFNGETFDRIY